MTEKYTKFISSYQEEVTLLNFSLSALANMAIEHLCVQETLYYVVDINEKCFICELEDESDTADIVKNYSDEFRQLKIWI